MQFNLRPTRRPVSATSYVPQDTLTAQIGSSALSVQLQTKSSELTYAGQQLDSLQENLLGNHPKAAIDNHFKTGHREAA
jgi:hypothetical protein